MHDIMMTSDKLQILYFYIENDSAGKARYSVVDQFSQSVYGYMDIWTVNCEWWNEIEEIEDKITLKICARAKEMRTQLPRLLAMVPPVPRVDPRSGQARVPTDILYDDFWDIYYGTCGTLYATFQIWLLGVISCLLYLQKILPSNQI